MEIYKESNTICMRLRRIGMAVAGTIGFAIVVSAIAFCLLTSPAVKIRGWETLDTNKFERIRHTVTVIDRKGDPVVENFYTNNRIFTPFRDIPSVTVDAFVSIEDKRFYRHGGVDYIRMLGAFKNNVMSGTLKEGASTITQQLIKNTHLSSEKTFSRKFQEIRIAKESEKKYSKDEILETYLNVVYFGNNIYGIGRAARVYFDKDVSQLSVSESALLAGIINNPSRYNPYTHADKAKARRDLVIDCMCRNGKITQADAEAEKAKELEVHVPQSDPYAAYLERAIAESAEVLDCLPEELFEKNCTIRVPFNKEEFNTLFHAMSDILSKLDINTHVIILENDSARMLFDMQNMSSPSEIMRQPGSAIKPFIAYAPALEKKLVFPSSVLSDEQTDFDGYRPRNFSDTYYGDVTVADSLKLSLNVPAVKLTDMCGIPYAKATAERFGLRFSDVDKGLAIALGGLHDGVTLRSLTDAYATLARGGIYRKSSHVDAVYSHEKCLYEQANAKESVAVGDDTAFLLTDMLRECAQSGTAQKLHCYKNVAAKTGTVERGDTNSDAYCIAYTPRYTVAVWCGCDDGSVKIYGGRQPTSIAAKILGMLNDDSQFSVPDSITLLDIDSKKLREEKAVYLAAPSLPKRYCRSVYFSKRNLPKKYSYGDLPSVGDFAIVDPYDFELFRRFAQ